MLDTLKSARISSLIRVKPAPTYRLKKLHQNGGFHLSILVLGGPLRMLWQRRRCALSLSYELEVSSRLLRNASKCAPKKSSIILMMTSKTVSHPLKMASPISSIPPAMLGLWVVTGASGSRRGGPEKKGQKRPVRLEPPRA